MTVPSPPTTRQTLEDLASRVVSALEHSLGQSITSGTWSDEETVPYEERQEWSRRELGAYTVTLGITRRFCDSSAGPRELGARAIMVVETADGRRVTCQFPPLLWTGDASLLTTLAEAGLQVDDA